jgi:hypothetical protein
MSEDAHGDIAELANTSLVRHLARGAIGFGLIGVALALTASVGPAALLLAPAGLIALRGCPACWIAGLIETASAGRLERSCRSCSSGAALRQAEGTAQQQAGAPRAAKLQARRSARWSNR